MMSMRKYLFILSLLVISTGTMAQYRKAAHSAGSSFELAIGGGYGSLGYGVASTETMQAKNLGDWAASAHIGYNYFFSEWVGIGVGVDVTRIGSTLRLEGEQTWTRVTDTDGERYDHVLRLSPWRETQQAVYLEPSLAIKTSIPAGDIYVIAEVGAKYALPVLSGYYAKGELTHTGYYKPWDLTLSDMAPHGFYTEDAYRPKGDIVKPEWRIAVFAKAGVLIPLVEHLDLMVQAYGQYSVTSSAIGGENVPGFRQDREGMTDAHYFMPDYTSYTGSALVNGGYRPWMVGAEIGLRYTIPHGKAAKNCHCRIIEN